MAGYETVDPPRGLSYGAPLVDFGVLADLPNKYYQGQRNRREQDVATAFQNQPLPLDPQTGLPDYGKIMQVLAQKGGIDAITRLATPAAEQYFVTQAAKQSPLLTSGFGPAGGSPATPSGGPVSVASLPAPSAAAASPSYVQGGDQAGSVVDIVSAKLPQDSQATGTVIANIARSVGVDPNAALTPAQAATVERRLAGYIARTQPRAAQAVTASPQGGVPAAGGSPAARVSDAFSAVAPTAGAGGTSPVVAAPVRVPPAGASAQPSAVAQPAAPPRPQQPVPAVSPAQPQQPLVPQVPLPRGYTDPQQAILALRAEAARVSVNPLAKGQAAALNDWADRIETAQKPVTVGSRILSPTGEVLYAAPEKPVVVGGSLVRPNTGEVIYQGADALLDDQTIATMAAQARAGDTSVFQNLGRGAQGAQNIVRLRREIARQNAEAGTSGSDQAMRNAEFFGVKAGERTLGTRQANIELAATEFKNVIPVVSEASRAVSRTNYPDLNRIIQFGEEKTGDPKIVAFGSGVNTLINLYARAISPTGVPTVSDKDHAREILNKAWSQGQFDAAVGMMEKEIDAALTSPQKVREEMRQRFGAGGGPGRDERVSESPRASRGGSSDSKVMRWERAPDGSLRPAQ